MASGDTLATAFAINNSPPDWILLTFTGGSVEPTADGDGTAVIWGDTSNATSILEYLVLTSGTWGGGDAAGYMLCSAWNGTDYQAENFTADNTVPADHGTLAGVQVTAFATPDRLKDADVLDFDASSNELALFHLFMPDHYAGGGITIKVGVSASSATTGDMSFAAFLKSISDNADNIKVKNFAAPNLNTAVDAPTTVGNLRFFTITFTAGADMDSIAKNEPFDLLIMRDAQDGTNDDMAGDAEIVFIEIKET